jgi:prefoldin subunit 5
MKMKAKKEFGEATLVMVKKEIAKLRKAENELVELLRELEQTLLSLKTMEDPERRRLLVRKMSGLFAEIKRNPTMRSLGTGTATF